MKKPSAKQTRGLRRTRAKCKRARPVRLPNVIELRDDVNDSSVARVLCFRRRDMLLFDFPDAKGKRCATAQFQHHNGSVDLVFWDDATTRAGNEGVIVPLLETK